VVLLGPQVKYELARFSQLAGPHGLQVAVIDMMDYGTLRGDKVLDQALSLIA
jgi:PTS system cellobiose-specific IIB component